jgi:hypothetical protein
MAAPFKIFAIAGILCHTCSILNGELIVNKKYLALSPEMLRRRLVKRGLAHHEVLEVLARVAERKKGLRRQRIHRLTVIEPWEAMIEPLKREIGTVASSMEYKRKNNQHEEHDFMQEYLRLLRKLVERFRVYQKAEHLSPKLAAQKKLGDGEPFDHWTHWIPDEIKRTFRAEQGRITHSKRGKRKELFPFNYICETELANRARLKRVLGKLLDENTRMLKLMPSNNKLVRDGELLNTAIARVDALTPTQKAPRKWDALLSRAERKAYGMER